jgi:hypothetical protein
VLPRGCLEARLLSRGIHRCNNAMNEQCHRKKGKGNKTPSNCCSIISIFSEMSISLLAEIV